MESIVGCPVGLRFGGMQPANTSRNEMFGPAAPIWGFLARFGGAANPLEPIAGTRVFETYPVLTMIALGWALPDLSPEARPTGRLPKYNPDRRRTFSLSDWQHVCERTSDAFRKSGLTKIVQWIDDVAQKSPLHKTDQDSLDACICLLVALYLEECKDYMMIGDIQTGYIVMPHCAALHRELDSRCEKTGRVPTKWVRRLRTKMADAR